MTTGSLSLVVCHANSPTDGAFPSKQILSTSDSNGLSGIQAPYEINFRDQKVAGSNPVTSTIFDRVCESKSGFFCSAFLVNPDAIGHAPFRLRSDDNR